MVKADTLVEITDHPNMKDQIVNVISPIGEITSIEEKSPGHFSLTFSDSLVAFLVK